MIYEMRTYTLNVGGVAEFEENFGKVIEKRHEMSPLIGFFHSEIGDLNRVMHIWSYKDAGERQKVRAALPDLPGWPPQNAHLIQDQVTKLMTAPPFRAEPRQGALGGVYEVRTYTMQIGKAGE
ncbi:MAG: NIPSNAP family protein, partial [bacterium]